MAVCRFFDSFCSASGRHSALGCCPCKSCVSRSRSTLLSSMPLDVFRAFHIARKALRLFTQDEE